MNKLSQFMHAPFEHHWGTFKRLICYLIGMRSLGIRLLADTLQTLHGFSDVDSAGNLNDHTSTGGFLIFIGANPISWSSTKQCTVTCSSTGAEYRAIAITVAEL